MQPHRNDLDLNRHVNNVKYIPWILEVSDMLSLPMLFLTTSPFELLKGLFDSATAESMCAWRSTSSVVLPLHLM